MSKIYMKKGPKNKATGKKKQRKEDPKREQGRGTTYLATREGRRERASLSAFPSSSSEKRLPKTGRPGSGSTVKSLVKCNIECTIRIIRVFSFAFANASIIRV